MKRLSFFLLLISFPLNSCKETSTSPIPNTKTPSTILPAPEGMVYIGASHYKRGSDKKQENGTFYKEESPAHVVEVSGFYIDQTEVTNAQFKKFVDATGYITFAEKGLSKKDFPKAPAEMLVAGSSVFAPPSKDINPHRRDPLSWWSFTSSSNWKQPLGPGSDILDKMNHPVVCLNHDDATAYAKWANKRLPTEAEWELAARGGLDHNTYTWGNQRISKDNKALANTFQGKFPATNTKQDGYLTTSPVRSFPPNNYGLYDMAGNVWEMCSDYYNPSYYQAFSAHPHPNPTGPSAPITEYESNIWRSTGEVPKTVAPSHHLTHLKVIKGGSFLCHISYCLRYRPAARHYAEPLTPTNHIGFRCAKDIILKNK